MPFDPIDVHVGARIRHKRKQLQISQGGLAEALGLTFQQVQKYERGANRVSASMLVKVARKLSVGIAYFFQGLPDLPEAEAESFDAGAVGAIGLIPELARVGELSREQQHALGVITRSMLSN